jgi:hypothetical protein
MRISVLAGAAAAALLVPALLTTAQAQVVLHSPAEIGSCLCLQQSVAALDAQVAQRRQAHEQSRQELEALEAEVRAQRSQIDVNNFDQIQAFKHLLDQRDKAASNFAGDATASYADAVGRYNEAVNRFNATCAGKAYDEAVLAQVRTGLSCPAPAR